MKTTRVFLGFIEKEMPVKLFEQEKNSISQTAWACVVYSMVPYLGILFVPFALIAGGVGIYTAHQRTEIGNRRFALICIGSSLFILGLQIVLWWLLYLIPAKAMPA